MTVAKDYFELFHTTCTFHIRPDDLGGVEGARDPSEYETWPICGKPAVAVYVSDDEHHVGRYVCLEHAIEAEHGGDGPVLWQRSASITCPVCKMTSYNSNDVVREYCGNCHKFHQEMVIHVQDDVIDFAARQMLQTIREGK